MPASINTKNDLIKKISINNKNAFNEWNDNIMYYKIKDFKKNRNEKKGANSSENKNQKWKIKLKEI